MDLQSLAVASQLTPKQLRKMQNRMMNEQQRLAKIAKKQSRPAQLSTGLSKGQRRRINQQKKKIGQALPRGLPVPQNPALSRAFPSGAAVRGPRRMNIVEDEFITNINGSTGFQTQGFYMNPGQSSTFPWLATLAKQFEKYEVKFIEFYYKPLVSAFATGGQSGKVMLSFDYDASDPLPSSKQQVEDTHPHADAMPYEECCLPLSPTQLNNQDSKYVRPGGLPASADIKTYDGGLLAVSTDGNSSTGEIGELRVRYSVDLFVPVLESQSTTPTNFHTSVLSFSGAPSDTAIAPYATTSVNPLGLAAVAGTIIFPAGNYVISGNVIFTSPDDTGIILKMSRSDTSAVLWDFETPAAGVTFTRLSGSWTILFSSSGSSTLEFPMYTANTTGTCSGTLVVQSV